jgi:hypothetical protein
MKYIKDLQPYSKYWGNCIVNMFISVLFKYDVSYESLLYLNTYEYTFEPDNVFHLDYTQDFHDYFRENIFNYEAFDFNDKENFLQEFKEVMMKNYVTLNVDLFHWNSTSYYYNKIHFSHLSFITGFDEEKGVFYAFEEDVNLAYDVREIPIENVIQAFNSKYKNRAGDYRILSFKNDKLPPYELDINHVKKCTKRLVDNLDMLIKKKQIIDKDRIAVDITGIYHYNFEFNKISNIYKANVQLLYILKNKGLLKETISDSLIEIFNETSLEWKNIRNVYLRLCLKKSFSEIDVLEQKISTLFMKEREIWSTVLEQLC